MSNNPIKRDTPHKRRSALGELKFRQYLVSSCCSTLATWLLRFLLGWQAWALTETAFWVGVSSALMLLPAFVLSPIFGVVSDRISPRNGMLITVTIQGAICALAATVNAVGIFNIYWLLTVSATVGFVTAAHHPIRLALIPKIVARESLPSAVGISAMVFNSARVVGPALGGWIVANTGTASAYVIAAVLFAGAASALYRLKGVPIPDDAKPLAAAMRKDIQAGIRFVLDHGTLRLVFLYTLINGLLGRSVIELLPAIAGKLLQGDPRTLAILAATAGVGSILGGLIIARQSSQQSRLVAMAAISLLLCAACLSPLHAISGLLGTSLVMAFVSLTATMVGTACQAITQLAVKDALRGRVMSLWAVVTMGSPAVGAFIMGALADIWGFAATLLTFAIAAAGAVLALSKKHSTKHH